MKLRYKIVSCSSQDPNFPVSNLLANVHHWETQRFPSYPQQITLMFYQPALVTSIKIISSFNKVPQKISILYHLPSPNNQSEFTKLGFVKFSNSDKGSDNLKSQTNFRQVKHINNISLKALYIRLIIYKNFPQKDNIFSQVALSSIIVEGSGYDLNHIKLKNNSEVFVNNFIQNKINFLNQFKENSIKNQQFNEANQIKQIIQHIRNLSRKISDLNTKKMQFVKQENYDQANKIKLHVQKIKAQIQDMANNFYDPNKKTIKNYSFSSSLPQNKSKVGRNEFQNQFITLQNQNQQSINQPKILNNQQNQNSEYQQDEQQDDYDDDQTQHNQKVVPALLNRLKNSKISQKSAQQTQLNQKQAFQTTLPAQPQDMSPSNEANSSCLTEFYQKTTIKKLHSKYWQFRLEAITLIQNECKSAVNSKIGKLKLRAYIFVYNKMVKEINKQILGLNLQLMNAITNLKLEDNQFKTELFLQLQKSVIQTLNVIQNSQNSKIHVQGEKVILRMIDSPIFGAQIIYNSIHRAYNDKLPPKIKIVYLQNLQYMISKYGITANGIPFTICDFAVKKSSDPNNQVRKAVLSLLKSIKDGGGQQRLKRCINQDQNFKNSFLLKQLKL